jgi:hypothetical protein
LPAVVARVLGAVVSAAFARSSVALAVLRWALIGRQSLLHLRLVLASCDDAVVVSCATRLSARLHHLLLQIGGIQEFLKLSLLLPQIIALQTGQFRGDVECGAEVLCGRAVGRLGDDRRQFAEGAAWFSSAPSSRPR